VTEPLSETIAKREAAKNQQAALQLQEQRRLYTELLARDAAPRPGDAEALAAVMAVLGKTSATVVDDLKKIAHLRWQRRLAKEADAAVLAEQDALATSESLRRALAGKIQALQAEATAAAEAHRLALGRRIERENAADNLAAREGEFAAAGLDPAANEGTVQL